MSRSLYSLILSDEVIRQIDRMAVRENTNRSALVNRVLAEYCSMSTPEKRIESVFDTVERFFGGDGELAAFVTPNQPTMFLKTSLEYRYRPTVRYDLRLRPHAENGRIGELAVTFRTQSAELLERIDRFFRLWIASEQHHAEKTPPAFALSSGRMTRAIDLAPDEDLTPESLAEAICAYVSALDNALKAYVAGRIDDKDIRAARLLP